MENIKEKICPNCNTLKDISQYKFLKKKQSYSQMCKECGKKKYSERKQKEKEKALPPKTQVQSVSDTVKQITEQIKSTIAPPAQKTDIPQTPNITEVLKKAQISLESNAQIFEEKPKTEPAKKEINIPTTFTPSIKKEQVKAAVNAEPSEDEIYYKKIQDIMNIPGERARMKTNFEMMSNVLNIVQVDTNSLDDVSFYIIYCDVYKKYAEKHGTSLMKTAFYFSTSILDTFSDEIEKATKGKIICEGINNTLHTDSAELDPILNEMDTLPEVLPYTHNPFIKLGLIIGQGLMTNTKLNQMKRLMPGYAKKKPQEIIQK